jgi:hypothetical protein
MEEHTLAAAKTVTPNVVVILSLVAALFPTVAYAEPTLSGLYFPLLWLVVVVGAVLFAMVPLLIKKLIRPRRAGWVFWLVSIVLGLLFLIFLGPIVVGLGSIFITGRTM